MPRVELIYDRDCPHVGKARALLLACKKAGWMMGWTEWECSDPDCPPYARGYGSPTILVDGKDVEGVEPLADSACCRLYPPSGSRLQGVPSVAKIVAALRDNPTRVRSCGTGRRGSLAALPGIGVALLPALSCPACWPAYAGLLGSVGLGFLWDATYLLPLTILLLIAAVAGLGYRAGSRRGRFPLALGTFGCAVLLVGKFALGFVPATYAGVGLLVAASAWNAWPRRTEPNSACPTCVEENRVGNSP